MGIIKRGILGGFRGSVANVVGTSWKGLAVIKSKPLSVANPRSTGQVAQRAKFSSAVFIASAILPVVIKPLWDRFAQGMSGYNAFVRYNLPSIFSNGDVQPTLFKASVGSLLNASNFAVSLNLAATELQCDWVDNSNEGNALVSDEVIITVVGTNLPYAIAFSGSTTRFAQTQTLVFPEPLALGNYVCYLDFKRPDGRLVSTSVYSIFYRSI